jgi:hypothetical protein
LRHHLSHFSREAQSSMRTLPRKERSFAAIFVLTLALGIAANKAVFSVVNTVMLRPPPFPDSPQLVWLAGGRDSAIRTPNSGGLSAVTYQVSAYRAYQAANRSLARMGSYSPYLANGGFTLEGSGSEAETVLGMLADSDLSPTLGVKAMLGRLIRPEEYRGARRNGE